MEQIHLGVWGLPLALGVLGCTNTEGEVAADYPSPQDALSRAYAAVEAMPEISTDVGVMEVHSVYKHQVAVEYEARHLPRDSVVARSIEAVFEPYESFWRGYVGDAERFGSWVRDHPLTADTSRLLLALSVDFAAELAEIGAGMTALTGRVPDGTWYIVYGTGATNLGGFGDGTMVVDFGGIDPDGGADEVRSFLPHEINHLMFEEARASDPAKGSVLYRIINEGFATYVSHQYWGEASPPADHLAFTPEEWDWAIEHEADLWNRARLDLESAEGSTVAPYVSRSVRLTPESPGAIGYFLGYRIVEAYVQRYGPGSWRDLYEVPVRETLERSGYGSGGFSH